MNLSREATIILRPPTATGLPSPGEFEDPLLNFLCRKWHVNFSTLAAQKDRRNVTVQLKPVTPGGNDDSSSPAAKPQQQLQDTLVYQKLQDTALHTEDRVSHVTDLRSVDDKEVCVHFAREQQQHGGVAVLSLLSSFLPGSSRTEWEVLAWGVEGKLESWMRETAYGIEDTSGEVRGDWRNRYAVVYCGATTQPQAGKQDGSACIEVWSAFESGLKPETLQKIRSALAALNHDVVRQLTGQLGEVARDDSRAKVEREGRKRTGKESGISEWLW